MERVDEQTASELINEAYSLRQADLRLIMIYKTIYERKSGKSCTEIFIADLCLLLIVIFARDPAIRVPALGLLGFFLYHTRVALIVAFGTIAVTEGPIDLGEQQGTKTKYYDAIVDNVDFRLYRSDLIDNEFVKITYASADNIIFLNGSNYAIKIEVSRPV